MRSRKALLLFFVAVLAGLGFWIVAMRSPEPASPSASPSSSALSTTPTPASSALPPPPAPAAPVSGSGVNPDFLRFVRAEALLLDAPKIKPEEAEARLQAQADAMGPEELRFARDTALSAQSAANERILATFLLGAAGPKAWPLTKDLFLAPPVYPNAQPHTLEEQLSMQQKTQKLMAVDSLWEQAKTDPAARRELENWAAETKEVFFRQYIQRKLQELPPL